ncbi:MAG: isocitrate lyase/phosphoenolpyruvate mutase family protein [Pseudomonadota bacterium]|nr:isocitrate lyase/phosphoenolpyruvate mutase family protein [Pseudomonadota bacterium]
MEINRPTQFDKAQDFRALHTAGGCFVIPNPWDAGSARLLSMLGFPALATTSAGFAFSRGKPDGAMPLEALVAHLADLVAATPLPISADLQSGFGDAPEEVARTILLAARAGVVGGSIEDAKGCAADPLHARGFAAERIRAASEAARALPFPFTLTARAENYSVGRPDLADTIGRLQAYQEAGADVLFAPGLSSAADIATLVRELDRPVNVMIGRAGLPLSVQALADLGVRRVSVGGSLARAALGALLHAATELRDQGTTTYANSPEAAPDFNALFGCDIRQAPAGHARS